MASGDYQTAVEQLIELLEYDDEEKTITYALVDAYVGLENYPKAIEYLNIIDRDSETIKERVFTYTMTDIFKQIATVDMRTLKDLSVDYIQHFNDKYILFKSGDKYGLLNRDYEVALAAKYYGILIGIGPFDGKIMVYKTAKHAKKPDYNNAVVLDNDLNEAKKKGYGFGYEEIDGYLVDVKDNNKVKFVDWVDDGDGDFDMKIKKVSSIEKDMLMAGGKYYKGFGAYNYSGTDFLVKASDLSVYKLSGNAVGYEATIMPDIFDDMIPVYKKKKCGYYNLGPSFVSEFVYDTLGYKFLPECNSFSQSYAAVKLDNKYGMINKEGNLVIPTEFDGLTTIVNGEFLFIYQGRVGIGRLK